MSDAIKPVGWGDPVTIYIKALEATITPRRQREAILGIDGGWLATIDQEIADLRSQINNS